MSLMSRIEDYALIGDLHTAALVGRDGSIDWLCLPRFDSPACFAALLADEHAGRWRLAPTDADATTERRYRDDTLILETDWRTATGSARVIDCMPPRGEAADVVRVVEGTGGTVQMRSDLRLRFDYGSIAPWLRHADDQLEAIAGPDAVWLHTDAPVDEGPDQSTRSDFTIHNGQRHRFVLTYQRSHLPTPARTEADEALRQTERFWTDWIAGCSSTGRWDHAVRRSAILLKALTYRPTGGILAAATTSLPEQPGGPRNWDYRYCWLRDATFTLQALLATGSEQEARAWREWLLRAVAGDPADLQIMYGLDGTRRVPEHEIDWLPGYAGSTPVRVGNGAVGQRQLDVWGEVLDGLHVSREAGLDATEPAWHLQRSMLEYLEGHWQEPDNGLWEVRGPRRQFVHSKVMAWVAFDRGVTAVTKHGLDGPAEHWRDIRDRIHADVCRHGYDPRRRTFTQFYGSEGLDAALLLIARTGFLPWSDPRIVGTVEAVWRELGRDGLLARYDPRADDVDGLPGDEGTFVACSFWLVNALQGIGRGDEARTLFERLLELRNDVGLLSEEYDARTGRQLGNTPQAFSLVGLINAARDLDGKALPDRRFGTADAG